VYVNESGKRKIDRRQEGEEGRERERERILNARAKIYKGIKRIAFQEQSSL